MMSAVRDDLDVRFRPRSSRPLFVGLVHRRTPLLPSLEATFGVGKHRPPDPLQSVADRLALRVAVVGDNDYSRNFVARTERDRTHSATVVGIYADEVEGSTGGSTLSGSISDLVAYSRESRVDAIVLALPMHDIDGIRRTRQALRTVTSDVYLAGDVIDLVCPTGRVDRIGTNVVLKINGKPLSTWQSLLKGSADRLIATLLLILLSPVLAVAALAICLDSAGPILFCQPRLGLNNRIFVMFKFRTMRAEEEDLTAERQTTRDDPRITRVGRVLRKTSIDELPQLLNVLRGDMSLVGPRPHAVNTKAGGRLFHEVVSDYPLRHRVKPGITGWAQINGWRGETRTFAQIENRVAHDLYYIENWSLWLDIKILVLTVFRELNSKVAF